MDLDKTITHKLEELNDEDLVKMAISGNTSAFEELYDRHAQLVYSKCRSFVVSGDISHADDLMQDVFVNVYIKLKSFKGNSKFSTWLYSFTYNHCVNYYNRVVKKKRMEVEVEINKRHELEEYSDNEISDDEIFSLATDKLKTCLQTIPPDDKVILLMKYQDDLSIKEMAKLLDIGESAVKMRVYRAKKKIVEIYKSL